MVAEWRVTVMSGDVAPSQQGWEPEPKPIESTSEDAGEWRVSHTVYV